MQVELSKTKNHKALIKVFKEAMLASDPKGIPRTPLARELQTERTHL
jgi:hypothetical protein